MNPFHHHRRLELAERLDGLTRAGQDTEDIETDLQNVRFVSKYTDTWRKKDSVASFYREAQCANLVRVTRLKG